MTASAEDTGLPTARLGEIELFAALDPDQLDWLARNGFRQVLPDGAVLFEDGQPAEHFYVLLAGELLISKRLDGREQVVARHSAVPWDGPDPSALAGDKPTAAHQFTGELPLLVGGGYVAKAIAVGPTDWIGFTTESFLEMISRCPQICPILLPVLAWRIRSYEAQAARRTMLAGLGTLAAGLAHELNNPVAAVVRTAPALDTAMLELADAAVEWGVGSLPAERIALDRALARASSRTSAQDALALASVEDVLSEWLVVNGIAAARDLAPILAGHGFTPTALDLLAGEIRPEVLGAALGLLAFRLDATTLLAEVGEAGHAISAVIESLAAYANLGRAVQREVDVVEGIEATLAMLAPALAGIDVVRDFAEVPKLPAYLLGLNQVWTNLIRNAVDAMRAGPGGGGELRITIRQQGPSVLVEIRDSGPGIPPDLMPRLGQPFFTTKDIGKGTGLGLHLTQQIVAAMHNGSLDVASVPGDTRFVVRLPTGETP